VNHPDPERGAAAGHSASPATPCGAPAAWSNDLIDVARLHSLLGEPDLCILDCRHDLARPLAGREQYSQGHIPGAVFASLDDDLAGARTADSGRHPLPERAALVARLQAWGARKGGRIVVYDASEGSYAARAWWLLRWLGHERVAVLDGGWPAWIAAGGPISHALPPAAQGDFTERPSLQAVRSLAQVVVLAESASSSAAPAGVLIDARAPDRYAGLNETVDPVAGHIPGARNRFWRLNLGPDGRFKPAAQLRQEYEELLQGRSASELTAQCGSGVTACHDLLALQVAGLPGAALFPGSWSQWITDPSRPVVTGSDATGPQA